MNEHTTALGEETDARHEVFDSRHGFANKLISSLGQVEMFVILLVRRSFSEGGRVEGSQLLTIENQ